MRSSWSTSPGRVATQRCRRVRPGDILGALTGDAGGLRGPDVGKIELQERLSYIAVSKRFSRDAVKRLNDGRIKGKRFRATLVEAETSPS